MSVDMFGRYQSQTTRQLTQIQSSKYPDTDKDLEQNLHRLNQFVDYIAQYLQVMQKGVDQANEDAIQRIRDMATDMVVMLGGGELLYGIDLGDLQYFLPALGAIFGFDSSKPFPISLIEMAEHFFLGYVIPLDSFVAEIQSLIDGWLTAMGLDPAFVSSVDDLLGAIGAVTSDTLALFNDLWSLLDTFGINTDGFGPFADLWHAVSQLLGQFNLQTLGNLVDPVVSTLAPWLHELAQMIDYLDQFIKAVSGGITDVQGLLNFAALFTPFTDLLTLAFDPLTAWSQIITGALNPLGLITAVFDEFQPLNAGSLFGLLPMDVFGGVMPLPFLTDQSEELIVDPNFQFDETIVGDGIWVRDATTTYLGGNSVKVIADGTIKELYSNKTRVTPGQTIVAKASAKWSGLTGSGSPIKAMLTYFLDDATVSTITIEAIPFSAAGGFTDLQDPANHVVPAGVNKASLRLVVDGTATAGSVWFAKPSMKIATDAARWADLIGISGIWDTLSDIFTLGISDPGRTIEDVLTLGREFAAIPQNIINSIWQGIFGAVPTGAVLLDDIIGGLQNLPPFNILGINGGTIIDTFDNIVNTLFGGFAQLFGVSGKSILDVASQASNTVSTANTGLELAEWNNAVASFRGGESLFTGLDPTEVSNFDIDKLFNGGADPVTLNASAGFTPMAFYRAKQSDKRGFIHWFGKGFTNVTTLVLDFYRFNYDTSQLEIFHTSSNQIGAVTAAWQSLKYNMATLDRFQLNQGETIGIGWRVTGTGTHSIAGLTAGAWLPSDNTVPAKQGAIRTDSAATTISFTTLAGYYSGNVPWLGIGIIEGDAPPDFHADRTIAFTASGPFVYDIPSWATHVDEIQISAGGGGASGDPAAFGFGAGGRNGTWVGRTLVRGVDFPVDATELTGTIGDGGSGGNLSSSGNGATGGSTTRDAITGGAAAATVLGGHGATTYEAEGAGDRYGDAPGDFVYNGITYQGGAGGWATSGQSGQSGQAPGAGGGGGSGGTWGAAWNGGRGARGGAWYVARQVTT